MTVRKETAKLAMTLKISDIDNDAKVKVATDLFTAVVEDKRCTLEQFLGLCGCYRVKRNLMGGAEIHVEYNTPIYCDPSSETYWSM